MAKNEMSAAYTYKAAKSPNTTIRLSARHPLHSFPINIKPLTLSLLNTKQCSNISYTQPSLIRFLCIKFITSAGERKSSYHPLVQRIWGLNGLIVPRNLIFWKTLIFWWYGNLCFPALVPRAANISDNSKVCSLIGAGMNNRMNLRCVVLEKRAQTFVQLNLVRKRSNYDRVKSMFKRRNSMTRVEIENQLLQEMHTLSVEKLEEILDFVLFLKHRLNFKKTPVKPQRPLGLLEGKAKCLIHEDFKITDEEFLNS
jgi:hypothetical protein